MSPATGTPTEPVDTRDLILLALVALAFIAAGIGLRNPWPADEPVYALIARDMLASGDWLIPTAGGDLYQDKPPLFFWLIAVSNVLTGSDKAGFLLPSLLAGLATVFLVQDLGRRLWNGRAGTLAALALLMTVQFTLQARRAQIDATLTLCTTLCLYGLLRALLLDGGWRWFVVAGLAAGAGLLAKIVGFLPFVVLLPYLYARWRRWPMSQTGLALSPREGRAFWASWWGLLWPWAVAALMCVLLAALWIVPLLLRVAHSADPQLIAYRDEVLLQQTFGRFVTPWHHQRPFYYYVQVMLTSWLPLALLLPWLVPRWWRSLRGHDARILLPLAFAACVVLFFSLSSGKRDVYILPALPAVALCAGPYLAELVQRRGVRRLAVALVLVIASLTAALCIASVAGFEPARRAAEEVGLVSLLPLLLIAAAGPALLLVLGVRRAPAALLGLLGVVWLVIGVWIWPRADATRSGSAFVARLEERAAADRELGLLEYHEQFLWNIRRSSVNFGHRRFREGAQESFDAARWLAADPSRQLLVPQERLLPCFAPAGSRLDLGVSAGTRWFLVSGGADAGCAIRGQEGRAIGYFPAWLRKLH